MPQVCLVPPPLPLAGPSRASFCDHFGSSNCSRVTWGPHKDPHWPAGVEYSSHTGQEKDVGNPAAAGGAATALSMLGQPGLVPGLAVPRSTSSAYTGLSQGRLWGRRLGMAKCLLGWGAVGRANAGWAVPQLPRGGAGAGGRGR